MEYKCVRRQGLVNLYTPIYRPVDVLTLGETIFVMEDYPGLHASSQIQSVGEISILTNPQRDWPMAFLNLER